MHPQGRSFRASLCVLSWCSGSALLSPELHGQGAINFNTRAASDNPAPVIAPIYGPGDPAFTPLHGNATTNGGSMVYNGSLLSGTGFTAQLWAAPASQGAGALMPLATTTMRPSGSLAGFVIPPIIAPTVPGAPGGTQVIFDLRVWDNHNGTVTSWAMVMADLFNVLHGSSGAFTTGVADLPNTPPNLVGLTSFNLFCVPEPGLTSLAVAGGMVLLMRRFLTSL